MRIKYPLNLVLIILLSAVLQARGGDRATAPPAGGTGRAAAPTVDMRPASGGPTLIHRQRKVEDRALKSAIEVDFPELSGVAGAVAGPFNRAIAGYIDAEMADFEKDVKTIADGGGSVPGKAAFTLDIKYEEEPADRAVISLRFQAVSYTGGAHGVPTLRTFNYDLTRGRMLALDDLFLPGSGYLKILADRCIAELRTLGLGDDDWIRRGAGPEAENYADWNFTPEGFQVTFGIYQVAPYAAGRQEVVVPYAALRPFARPDGPLALFLR